MMDKIILEGMSFYGYHGAFKAENELGQIFLVDLELFLDLQEAGESDDLEKTVHYGEVFELVKGILEGEPVQLIEHLAERIAKQIFSHYNRVLETKVKITKNNPPIPGHYKGVSIEIARKR
ncbi:dihydroneopterin aldolase [Mammaliicoccus sp. Dog046]|uniref:dihydroneopterin aldolase n=1 Tax=Mammaliicoccus sp. Dog046 TaxID=3034233 RepID=UPI002B25A82B|nr:dihydroneopterin aldolase [Mammaliicoccus sp. Dog046]WQK86737.1 dihydroneopterin aldolase [Mammaliicoccus sp. Dog046]